VLAGLNPDGTTRCYFLTKMSMCWLFGTNSLLETRRKPFASTSLISSS